MLDTLRGREYYTASDNRADKRTAMKAGRTAKTAAPDIA
jgi:hypothetical protein